MGMQFCLLLKTSGNSSGSLIICVHRSLDSLSEGGRGMCTQLSVFPLNETALSFEGGSF